MWSSLMNRVNFPTSRGSTQIFRMSHIICQATDRQKILHTASNQQADHGDFFKYPSLQHCTSYEGGEIAKPR